MDFTILKRLGFSDKSAKLYLALLQLGPSSVRDLATHVGFNRGTTYDGLKWLQESGMVDFYKKQSKQHFVAAPPSQLSHLFKQREEDVVRAGKELEKTVSELEALYNSGADRPIARYYGKDEVHLILEDVLQVCEQTEEKLYRIYSAEGVRKYLYEHFPTFSDARVAKGVGVRVIAIGDGGELRGLDERKWLADDNTSPESTYIIVYPGKVAHIALNPKSEPVGVVVENNGVYETQKLIFDALWRTLP